MELNRRRTQLQAYFAGLLDGEGTIGIYANNKQTLNLRVRLEMTDPVALGLLWIEYPEGYLSTHRIPKNATMRPFAFTINGLKAYQFLKDIEPFVLVKWQQVKVALAYLTHRRRTAREQHKLPCMRCARYARLLRELKIMDDKGVNTVEALSRHGLREYRAKPEAVEHDVQRITAHLARILEGVETSGAASTANKPISAPEQEIVH